ncbi:hypothetical protein BZA70DRAFT_283763 [Myxozyma melibiosi]|uniref:DUF4185 domain-containing protein n=1 Tax=Myxozyma melibiosi TaxID=54550 RepID=A0ABR1EZN0_9ASCO
MPSPPPKLKKFERIGTLKDVNGHNYTRDIGCSSVFNRKPIWLFGDTFPLNDKGQMIGLLTSTAAMGNEREPTKSKYWICKSDGKPAQFIPFTDEEWRFNKEHQGGGKQRYFLWSFSSIVETSPGQGWVFFTKGRTQSTNLSDNVGYGVQIGRVSTDEHGMPVVTRCMNEPLFPHNTITWGSFETLIDHDYIYLYGEKGGQIFVSRVPNDCPTDRSKYEFWTKDNTWSKEQKNLKDLFWKLQSGTVFWSKYYNCFILIGCTMWADNKIIVRHAKRPEGPWTSDALLYQLYKPQSGFNYCVNVHPWAFPESNGGELLVSWTDQHTGVVELGKITWEGYND